MRVVLRCCRGHAESWGAAVGGLSAICCFCCAHKSPVLTVCLCARAHTKLCHTHSAPEFYFIYMKTRLDMNQMSWHESMFRAQLKPLSCY